MIEPRADRPHAIMLGADKAYDMQDFVNKLRSMRVTPLRKQIEEPFGWIQTIAGQDNTKFRGRNRVGWAFTFAAAAYDLVRLPKLIATSP
jgi:hypothetical protein